MEKSFRLKLLYCAGLALFWVVFLWNFWSKGVYALGMNAFIFLSLFFWLFLLELYKNGRYAKNDLAWIIPTVLIVASFSLYDNPFLKIVNLLVLPVMFVLFYSNALLAEKKTTYWNADFIIKLTGRALSILGEIHNSIKAYGALIIPASKTNKHIIMRIVAGMVLFLASALIVFIPLLSSADAVFSQKVEVITIWFENIFSTPLVYRIGVFIILSVVFFSAFTAWSKPFDHHEKEENNKQVDSIIVGIVLGGILCVYLFFLWIQVNRLWIGALPFDFKETEQLVKSGFWQLLALSLINIFIYFFAYKKTVPFVQKILIAFTIASLLLLASAGHRMGLYVIYYGFSYEKFFASYTVLYCAILYLWLIAQLFQNQRSNIVKFLIMLFLWMFAVVSIFPIEQFIFRTNMALHNLKDSRIILSEMRMLSPDVLPLVKKNKEKMLLEGEGYDWNKWIEDQEKLISEKVWYERNVMNIAFQ
ncbi:MAG: hypothetical protein A3J55_02750 [Candidatus Ryanbacteria bacterium RIFCSPHIGHO2_02_FULL_45_17b]|nr:MAG: hypothetical protein A3J55_02750 [Candidatus Ryanbacteria bacterium RIFCSPHIGHO2_02_FULL_45_17b]